MTLAALLCGLFYGAFLQSAYREWKLVQMGKRIQAEVGAILAAGECACGECCGCSTTGVNDFDLHTTGVPGVTMPRLLGDDGDLSKAIRTGHEDG